jgi:hypothetical protein
MNLRMEKDLGKLTEQKTGVGAGTGDQNKAIDANTDADWNRVMCPKTDLS